MIVKLLSWSRPRNLILVLTEHRGSSNSGRVLGGLVSSTSLRHRNEQKRCGQPWSYLFSEESTTQSMSDGRLFEELYVRKDTGLGRPTRYGYNTENGSDSGSVGRSFLDWRPIRSFGVRPKQADLWSYIVAA